VTVVVAIALPVALWWPVIADIASVYRFQFKYFLGWAPWALMVLGILFFIPVAWSEGRDPEGRFYPKARNAYMGWGVTLYLLGFLIAWQVARIHDGALIPS
jgi:hypothetical protein